MFWNHRLMQRVEGEGTSYEEVVLYVVEVFYNESDNSIIGWSEKEYVWGENLEEVRQSLHWMLDALDKPVLIEADLLQRAEEIRAMGGDTHEIGISENGDIDLGIWEDDGGTSWMWDQD